MSIEDIVIKIKSYKRFIKIGLFLFVFMSAASFFFVLGKISAIRDARIPIVLGTFEDMSLHSIKRGTFLEKSSGDNAEMRNISETTASKDSEGIVVASKQGKSYHLLWCSGAKRILPENKIFFASASEAKKACLLYTSPSPRD